MTGPRLSIIPARACTDQALKPRDLQVLCVLGRHTDELGWCTKSQVKMSREIGCARSTVFEAIERLVAAGYLERHVQEEANGRDSPHNYRVILDPVHPNPGAISAEPDEEFGTQTPADQSAPPAGISAPPAGPGPAPKNDPLRTIERDAREDEDPKKIDADGWDLLKNWPQFAGMPKEPAMAEWRKLSADDRAAAKRCFLPWLELLKKQKKSHTPAPSTYFKERLWKDVPNPVDAPAAPVLAKPFGKAWGARRMQALLAGVGPLPPPSAFIAGLIAAGGETGERERLRHQATHGWPVVNRMHERAAGGQGTTLSPGEEPAPVLLSLMEPVEVDCPRWREWKAEHERRGWPWLPDTGRQQWVYFPAGGPERLSEFERALRGETEEQKGNHDDAGRCEAAG
jgi:hypothetical protein